MGRNANAFNFAGANQGAGMNGVPGLQRGQASRGVDLGGMGGNVRQPMKGGITFQDLLSRLQGELQKSRETGNELTNLNGTMSEIHDTLGGNLVCSFHVECMAAVSLMRRSVTVIEPFLCTAITTRCPSASITYGFTPDATSSSFVDKSRASIGSSRLASTTTSDARVSCKPRRQNPDAGGHACRARSHQAGG